MMSHYTLNFFFSQLWLGFVCEGLPCLPAGRAQPDEASGSASIVVDDATQTSKS